MSVTILRQNQRQNQTPEERIKQQKREWYYRNRKSVLKQQKKSEGRNPKKSGMKRIEKIVLRNPQTG